MLRFQKYFHKKWKQNCHFSTQNTTICICIFKYQNIGFQEKKPIFSPKIVISTLTPGYRMVFKRYHGKGSNDRGSNDQGSNFITSNDQGPNLTASTPLGVERRAPNNERQTKLKLKEIAGIVPILPNLTRGSNNSHHLLSGPGLSPTVGTRVIKVEPWFRP
jgi:hypothetical protein